MSGGVSCAIRKAGGWKVEFEAIKSCLFKNPKVGDIYVTSAGRLSYNGILHLVTMKIPGIWSSLKTVEKCLYSLVYYCSMNNINTVALPALGTGTGSLDYKKVGDLYINVLSQNSSLFVVVDINERFIDYINTRL